MRTTPTSAKQLTIVGAGGGYDLQARVATRHLGKQRRSLPSPAEIAERYAKAFAPESK